MTVIDATDKEREVLDLMLRGCQDKEVAHRLHVSTSTVKQRRSRLMRRIRAQNEAQLWALMLRRPRRTRRVLDVQIPLW